jgi:hypothetical protein
MIGNYPGGFDDYPGRPAQNQGVEQASHCVLRNDWYRGVKDPSLR